jgi:hypothetical protein
MLHWIPTHFRHVQCAPAEPWDAWRQGFARFMTRCWDNACRRAERPDRVVPYY